MMAAISQEADGSAALVPPGAPAENANQNAGADNQQQQQAQVVSSLQKYLLLWKPTCTNG